MNLGLISPKGTLFFELPEFREFWDNIGGVGYYKNVWSGISTALPLLAALTPPSFDIRIIDENSEVLDYNEPYDIVGISAMTKQATRAYEIADKFRAQGVYVVMGGIHPTVMYDEAGLHADTVIAGEAEELWPVFIEDYLKGHPRTLYKNERPGEINLARSPVPRYNLMKKENYSSLWPQTTRGCPHYCEFCAASNIYGPKFRHKTIDQVLKEVEIIKETWKNGMICFADDNMFVDREFSKELLREFIPLKFSWMAQSDISAGEDDQLLELLFDSGCEALYVGLETLSEKNLVNLDPHDWKLKKLRDYPVLIQRIQEHGIGIHGSFMLGFDEDTEASFQNIIDFIIENKLFGGTVSILTPYPGSKLRERLEKEGRLLDLEWSKYNGGNVTFMPRSMDPRQLYAGFLRTWREIYAPAVQEQKRDYFKSIYKKLLKEKKNKEREKEKMKETAQAEAL
jgi:radical SAM superfamily enzyme YgiQ (UPF0313 family)